MKKLLTLTILLVLSNPLVAQDKKSSKATGKQKVIYKYRKYEKFDLGNLEIKGSIVAPGDLSVKERSRRTFSRDLYDRDNFNKEVIEDIRNLR
ncbi:MAG: hypothetical protein KC493_14650 [Bacteriovoracaceae bacterium]|nr:hypothetical protein [Bacteriovoracaceae bacterium]